MNKLLIECVKSDIKELDNQIIHANKELSKLHNKKKKLELKLIVMDTRTEDERLQDEYPIKYCFDTIRDERCLWDLRFWKSSHDRIEVIEWVDEFIKWNIWFDKNAGHCTYMIYILIAIHRVEKEKVIDAIMDNKFISCKDSLGELV